MLRPIETVRLISASFTGPFAVGVYPNLITRERQVKEMMQIISTICGAAISIVPGVGVHAKTKVASTKGTSKVEMVIDGEHEEMPIITISDPVSKTQILPTIHFLDSEVNIFGWTYGVLDSKTDQVTLGHNRIRGTVDHGKSQLFFQGNLRGFSVDELQINHTLDSGLKVQAGRIFLSGSFAHPAPFLIPTITGTGIPTNFYGVGVGASGPLGDNWTVSFDVTGKSDVPMFSSETFGRLEFSGYVERSYDHGHIRLAFQQAGDMRIVFDGERRFGPHLLRGAAYVRNEGNVVGAYALIERRWNKRLRTHLQATVTNDNFQTFGGINFDISDGVTLTGEFSAGEVNVRLLKQW